MYFMKGSEVQIYYATYSKFQRIPEERVAPVRRGNVQAKPHCLSPPLCLLISDALWESLCPVENYYVIWYVNQNRDLFTIHSLVTKLFLLLTLMNEALMTLLLLKHPTFNMMHECWMTTNINTIAPFFLTMSTFLHRVPIREIL